MQKPHSEGKPQQPQISRTRITKRYKLKIVQVYALTTPYSEEDINSFYNDVDETLGKPNHYMIVMGDFNAQIDVKTPTGKFGLELGTERCNTLVKLATLKKYKIMNTVFQKIARRRWKWKSPNGVEKAEIDYILTNRCDVITDVTVINQVNIGRDHRMVVGNIKLDVEVERKNVMSKKPPNRINEDRIPTQIEKPIRDTTRT